jgi:hypothetical protein
MKKKKEYLVNDLLKYFKKRGLKYFSKAHKEIMTSWKDFLPVTFLFTPIYRRRWRFTCPLQNK